MNNKIDYKKPYSNDYHLRYHISEIKRTTIARKTGRSIPITIASRHSRAGLLDSFERMMLSLSFIAGLLLFVSMLYRQKLTGGDAN